MYLFYNDESVCVCVMSFCFEAEKMLQYSTLKMVSDTKLDLVSTFG